MAYRCPYCRTLFSGWQANRCPACRKTLLPPGYFSTEPPRPAGSKTPSWSIPGRRPGGGPAPRLTLAGRPLTLFLALGALLLSGLALIHRARHPTAPDERANLHLARLNLEVLAAAVDVLREDCGRFPTPREGLTALIHPSGMEGWQGPYIVELKPDPWGKPFQYTPVSGGFVVRSAGPDRVPDTAQDIVVTGRPGLAREPAQLWMER